jgi:hypothetical protein
VPLVGIRSHFGEGSGFTLMMEALVMVLSAEMPVDARADFLCRVLVHYVEQAHASLAKLVPSHQCFRRRTGTALNFVLRRRLAHAHQETEQQISPQQGEIESC